MKTSKFAEGRFAKLVEEFFLDRLIRQRNSSSQTVALRVRSRSME
jgi:hypothetical protein